MRKGKKGTGRHIWAMGSKAGMLVQWWGWGGFRGTHQASRSERPLGQRRGPWSETAASAPRTFDSTPAFDSSLRKRDSKQPQALE